MNDRLLRLSQVYLGFMYTYINIEELLDGCLFKGTVVSVKYLTEQVDMSILD